jgi:hypothetical protein
MPLLNTSRLEAFARLIALGYPPVLAAKGAGYRNLRASRAATRLAPPQPVAAPEAARAAPAKEIKTGDRAQTAPPARPPLPPMLTEEEWLAEFAPLIQREKAARA